MNSLEIIFFNPSDSEYGAVNPVSFNFSAVTMVSAQNFLILMELIGYFFPVILAKKSKAYPPKRPMIYGSLKLILRPLLWPTH